MLHLAVCSGRSAALLNIVGARNVNATAKNGLTPLMYAIGSEGPGLVEAVRWLLSHGAVLDVRDIAGRTALGLAREKAVSVHIKSRPEYEHVVRLLEGRGAEESEKRSPGG